jgi:hypothetical protein
MSVTLSIITATCGRDTLTRALASVAPQLGDGDELLVIRNDNAPKGNATRDEAIKRAAGTHLYWLDDDDVLADNALETIRLGVAEDPDTVHIFRMQGDLHRNGASEVLWAEPVVRFANVGGSQCVVPNVPGKLGMWAGDAGGDFRFLTETLELLGRDPIFHPEVIAQIRP